MLDQERHDGIRAAERTRGELRLAELAVEIYELTAQLQKKMQSDERYGFDTQELWQLTIRRHIRELRAAVAMLEEMAVGLFPPPRM